MACFGRRSANFFPVVFFLERPLYSLYCFSVVKQTIQVNVLLIIEQSMKSASQVGEVWKTELCKQFFLQKCILAAKGTNGEFFLNPGFFTFFTFHISGLHFCFLPVCWFSSFSISYSTSPLKSSFGKYSKNIFWL